MAAQENAAATGTPKEAGPVQAQAVSGTVEKNAQPPAQPAGDGGAASNPGKRRKKRRRGRKLAHGGDAGAGNRLPLSGEDRDTSQGSDAATSLKGKKAARRRGRRRWQSVNGAPEGVSSEAGSELEAGTPQDKAAHAGDAGHAAREPSAKDADIRVTKTRDNQPRGSWTGVHGERARNGHHRGSLYAALDLGTNNCRLLIARPEDRGFRVVDAYSRIVRLGEGVGSNKRLGEAAMDRAIDALANCHRKLADRGVSRSRLIATEACRAAENGTEFIERVQAETGLALEVVNRETEARLAVAGCASLVDHDADGVILFDIGGGSSEIVWLDLRNRCGARGYALTRFIRSWISLPVGVVNLAERHGGVHVTPDVFEAMVEDAAGHLASFSLASSLTEAISTGRVHMLGTSGTVTTLAGVHLGLKRYDRRRVDGTWLEDGDVGRMIDQLRDMPYEARVENPCIGEDRADLVLAGCAILEAIRRRWSCSRLRVADRGLREGILTELMSADGVWTHRKSGNRQDRGRQRNRA
ncbi:exopolyphosphatase/guanosine-5'-triphosphate,3'-diphosphate pyrophosphatase [Roseibium marinum]|uniref:Exopolyphosphatase/guanosine-5'-triphosphate, 3'-diphosphate pyrophosphatase n=1 Tax=Roseibium marinum TaxID=281252 RepID=A0A2S3UNZ8_9HYPH|nr:exopolyphosphatase/guanosine-5'-triphosphate,3'-diphosphate pyrophosphatase [Roseibium marinum]